MLRVKHALYSSNHNVDVSYRNGLSGDKIVFVQVFEINNVLEIKLRDANEYSFNYTARIDWNTFEKIKIEQSLEITYEEFKQQVIELLKQTLAKEMLLKLEADEDYCKIIFYEKSRIKSLIFLMIDLELTNQKEIIDEMAVNLMQMKEANKTLSNQLMKSKNEIAEKDITLCNMRKVNFDLEKQFCQNIQQVEHSFVRSISLVEKKLSDKLQKINLRHLKLLCDLERIKSDNKLKGEASTRLVQSLQNLRVENDKHYQTIRNLQMEVDNLSMLRTKSEKNCCDLRQTITRKEQEINELQKELSEIRKDIKEAAVIIAQKTKTHDELAKDLVQANTMIVNFNNHMEVLSEEVEKLKGVLGVKEKNLAEKEQEIKRVSDEFSRYKNEYKVDDMKVLKHELFVTKQIGRAHV